jgi:hypothetical protein
MKSIRRVLVLAPLCATLTLACSSLPPPGSSYDHDANFSSLKTYGWYSDPAEDKTVGSSIVDTRFVEDHVKKNIVEILGKKGYRPAGDATPDFYTDYHTRVAAIVQQDQYGRYAWWAMPTYLGTQTYREGTLAVDVRDASKKLIWRGWVTKLYGKSPEAIAKNIRRAVEEILASFPPGATPRS